MEGTFYLEQVTGLPAALEGFGIYDHFQSLGKIHKSVDYSWCLSLKNQNICYNCSASCVKQLLKIKSVLRGQRRKVNRLGPNSPFYMKVKFALHVDIKVPQLGRKAS